MRTLILLRHAKSSWDDASLADHDRPLAPRGRRAAPAMAGHLEAHGIVPDLVLCSTSVRTRQTLALMEERLGSPEAEFDPSLYLAGPSHMLRRVRSADDSAETLMLVGHNPGMHDFALGLSDRGETGDELDRLERKFPTAAVAVLEFDIDAWSGIEPGRGRLLHFVRPKDLPTAERDRL